MTSTWCHLNAVRVICQKFSRTVYLHFVLIKLSNFCTERCQTFTCGLRTAQTLIQFTVRWRQPCSSMFTIRTSTVLVNWNGGWFSSGAILTRTLSIQLLNDRCTSTSTPTRCQTHVRTKYGYFEHTNINSLTVTIYDLFSVTGLLKFSVHFAKIHEICWYLLLNFCQAVQQWSWGRGGRFYSAYVHWSFLTVTVKKIVKISQQKPKILQK